MRLLLDTHMLVWALRDTAQLPVAAKVAMTDSENEVMFSVVNLFEIAIKNNKFPTRPLLPLRGLDKLCEQAGIRLISLTPEHIEAFETTPRHHADPIDRLLVAQARIESAQLLTTDAQLEAYGSTVFLVA